MSGVEAHVLTGFYKLIFQLKDALTGPQARLQLLGVAGLNSIVVRSGLKSLDDVLLGFLGSEQNHVDIGKFPMAPDHAANSRTVELRHHPVQQRQARALRLAKGL